MTRLFNNKYFISVLAALTIIFCVSKIVIPATSEQDMYSEDTAIENFDDELETSEETPFRALQIVDTKNLFWQEKLKRDPFTSKNLAQSNKKHSASNNSSTYQPKNTTPPSLTGFISGSNSRYAVLNKKIMREGEAINNYKIIRIDTKGVHLFHTNSHDVITLSMDQ